MAEYQEVMKQKQRMCRLYTYCSKGCPLNDIDFCGKNSGEKIQADFAEVERRVMEWAAEHSEPVYPTWAEYLKTHGFPGGISIPLDCELRGCPPIERFVWLAENHIPADIAEKLGVEPKEE